MFLVLALALAADPDRGEVLAGVAGCASCHTAEAGEPFAGGYRLETRFGTFVGSNLTTDRQHGLGDWNFDDFERAMRKGRSPEHRPYYPAFPYPAFTGMTDADLRDLWAYLQGLPAVARPEEPHDLHGIGSWRFSVRFWKLTGYDHTPRFADRGAYLAQAVAHCGECHTPRGKLGSLKTRKAMSGTESPPEPAPNITPSEDGIGGWSARELTSFLEDGMEPDGNMTGGHMRRVVRHGTALLTDDERRAIADYILDHPPLDDRGKPSAPPKGDSKDASDW